MNLTSLWSGNDYAYYNMRGRGETWRPGASRVRVIRVFKRKEYGNERDSGFAVVFFVSKDGTLDSNAKEQEVRARDIAMRWEEYEDERDHREANRARIEQELEAERIAKSSKNEQIIALLEKKGIDRNWITSITDHAVMINRHALERALETNGT